MLSYSYSLIPQFFHAIFLCVQPYNLSNTPPISHLILMSWMLYFLGVRAWCSSLPPHISLQDILSLSHDFHHSQFTASYQLLLCDFIQDFSPELQNHSIVDTSPLTSQIYLKCTTFALFSLLGSYGLKILLSYKLSGTNLGVNLDFFVFLIFHPPINHHVL